MPPAAVEPPPESLNRAPLRRSGAVHCILLVAIIVCAGVQTVAALIGIMVNKSGGVRFKVPKDRHMGYKISWRAGGYWPACVADSASKGGKG